MSSTERIWPKEVKVSSPGKVILHGEHSVVYGKRAVALSLDLRTQLTITAADTDTVSLNLPDVDIQETWPLEAIQELWRQMGRKQTTEATPLTDSQASHLRKFLGMSAEVTSPKKLALLSFLHLYLAILPQPLPIHISVNSQLPTGAGLGSSAAYAVCLSGALLHIAGHLNGNKNHDSLENVCQWAFMSEKIVHGTPSGIDNSICTYGGAVNFKGGKGTPVEVPPLRVLLVNTGVPRSTKALVAGVRDRRERYQSIVEPILQAMDSLADQGLETLCNLGTASSSQERIAAHETLEELVEMNHSLLCSLGVSHPSLDRIVSVAKSNGFRAKLTGAGGGGFGLVVVGLSASDQEVAKCQQELEESGFQVWSTSLGAPGFTLHHTK